VSNATAVTEMRPAEPAATYRTSDPFADFVKEASRRFGIPVRWIRPVINVESTGDVRARSPKGAMGLMQIMQRHGQSYVCGTISATILMTTFLRVLRIFANCATGTVHRASLHAGPARYEEHLAGRPLSAETQTYLLKLMPVIGSDIAASSAVASPRSSAGALFVMRSESSRTAARLQPGVRRIELRRSPPFTTSRPLCHRQQGCSSRDLMREARDD
jgi:hypothetical protein